MHTNSIEKKTARNNTSDIPVILLIILLSLIIRLIYLTQSQFPLNDGGLFFQMTKELITNHFLLPDFTSYNHLNIPFAYPPLSFYLAGGLNKLFKLNILQIFRFLPLVFNLISIPVFYFLAKEFLENRTQILISTGVFGTLMPVFEWLIMGGGIARSPGFFFCLLSLLFFLKYQNETKRFYLFISAVFSAVTFCTHLEMFWFLVISICILTTFGKPKLNIKKTLHILLWGLLSVILSSPYWGVILFRHGLSPFVSAFQTGEFNFGTTILSMVIFEFSGEQFLQIIQVFAIIGALICIKDGKFKIPLWAFLLILLDQRSINRSISIPFSLMAGIGLEKIIYTPFSKTEFQIFKIRNKKIILKNTGLIILIAFLAYSLLTHFLIRYTDKPVTTVISQTELDSFEWVKENSPTESNFLILPSGGSWQSDAIMEWFPALTGRNSLLTVQGTEWKNDGFFSKQVKAYLDMKKQILYENGSLEYKNPTAQTDYIYCSNTLNRLFECEEEITLNNIVYYPVYSNERVVIYKK